ncbi:(2Fe-2S)-binding protein [Allopusillimonas soli]|uniref:(2Fe-2S)-binding protein n=1 Tax=Allopusillimonas soli TaxID=659016 RepID=A0A853F946_9BURK|nr:(2Fe-2S)-binding protein [Allopusillimonas soli]NYT36469.1 (2Fe-2S)-binding protein [Allopusillimonas soli]TEA74975.1 (2Fe-2S)-binding protein [Allopusillimonas soli]
MFQRLPEVEQQKQARTIHITIDDMAVTCMDGDSVAAALFSSGTLACRDTAISQTPRGPFCLMGVCYDCLVIIDGKPNQQACMTRAQEGMHVQRQSGAREVQP